jgi:hypothetical protein
MGSYLFSLFVGAFDTAIVFLFFVAIKGGATRFHLLGRGWIYLGAVFAASICSFPLPRTSMDVKLELFGKFALAGVFGVYASARRQMA